MDGIEEAFAKIRAQWLELPEFTVPGFGGLAEREENIRAAFQRDIPSLKSVEAHGGVCSVVAYGPSLNQSFPKLIEEVQAGNTVITVSGAHDFVISRGLIPDYHAEMDIRERKVEFVRNSHPDVHYLIASVCHPAFWDVLGGRKVTMWHLGDLAGMDAIVRELDPGAIMHPSAQCIGLNALILMHTLGFRTFMMHGFDCSYGEQGTHAGEHNGSFSEEGRMVVKCGDREFQTRPEWVKYAQNFMNDMVPRMPGCRFGVHGDGLMQHMLKEGLKEAEHGSAAA